MKRLAKMTDVSRSMLYEEMKAGRLVVRKCGKRSVICIDDAMAWLKTLPQSTETAPPPQT